MHVLLVTIQIQPEHREAFIQSMLDDARGSVLNEPGCLRFDVLQDSQDPNKIYLYEAYRDEAAFQAHGQTPHLARWRKASEEVLSEPTSATRCTTLFPRDYR